MEQSISLNDVLSISEDVVARTVEGEFLIIPIASGVGDMEDELYSLNECGKAIWDKLDGKKSLAQVKADLMLEYEVTPADIENDVLSFAAELFKRNILVRI
ncbi:PqqD family protein [candidate division KSB1 bacterium]|nr:MAG: PqqD family protein [candidate division KSB1 bacterium]